MSLRPERLTELLEEVAHERLSLRTGSPSDAELGREKLADLAISYIPELVDEVRRLSVLLVLPALATPPTPTPALLEPLGELVGCLPCFVRPAGDYNGWCLVSENDRAQDGEREAMDFASFSDESTARAAAAILNAMLATARTTAPAATAEAWVSVLERLPESFQTVWLVVTEDTRWVFGHPLPATYRAATGEDEACYLREFGRAVPATDAMYWMPRNAPTPPTT